ncbi:IPT/TIG domain-containing protein [Actinoplanes sp. GCM10030250]|uniref:IPT/TIG domain-containing protein n=1 Tax=Actinoplanes sp. GCM10030250 TaxID=3273376 RepID=UPI003619A6EA
MKKSLAITGVAVVAAGVSISAAASAAPVPVPAVSTISPAKISAAGGTTVTITGANLTGATAVTIGGSSASSVTVVSATKITAVAPAGTNGAAAVAVTTSNGTSVASTRSSVTYRVPLGIDVSGGPVAKAGGGPLLLEITGGELGDTAKAFAAEKITVMMGRSVLRATYVDAGHLNVTMPGLAADDAELTVVRDTVAGPPATVTLAPVVTSLSAKEDLVVGGKKVSVRVAGAAVAQATGFMFGDTPADCTAKGTGSALAFECVVPAAAAAGPVWVSFTSGSGKPSRFTAASTFSYTD